MVNERKSRVGNVAVDPAGCALESITRSAPHQGGGPEARTPQSTVSAQILPRATAIAGQGWRPAGPAGGWASGRVRRTGAARLSDSSPRRAASGPASQGQPRAAGRGVVLLPRLWRDRGRRGGSARAAGRPGTHPEGGGLREPAKSSAARGGGAADCAARTVRPRVGTPPRARAMNQRRGERRGRELRESHGEGRGLLQFPVLLRTPDTSGTHRNSPPFGPGGKDGSLREEDDAPRIFAPQTWRQGGDRCEGKWERPGKEKWETENLAGPRVQLLPGSAGPTADAEEWRQTHEGLC